MKLKEKFDSIDQSKLNSEQKEFLSKIEKATKNFTSDNKEVNDKVEGALDKMIATFKEKMPEAIKTKAEKKEPKAIVKKTTVEKPTAKPSRTSTPKRTVMSMAKEIRKDGESWSDAQKRARAEMNKDKKSATKEVKTEMQKLMAFIKTRKELEGISGTDLKRDSVREAKPRGRRISKDGNVYYENRENRIDRLAPNYPKDSPMLENGGDFQAVVYKNGGRVETLTKELNRLQRELNSRRLQTYREGDNSPEEMARRNEREVKMARFNEVLKELRESESNLAKGGMLSPRERYILEIKGITNLRVGAIETYIDDNNLNESEILNIVIGLGRKQIKASDFVAAVVGKPNNEISKEIISFAKSDKALKMELGGYFKKEKDVKFKFAIGENVKVPQMGKKGLELVDAKIVEQIRAKQNDGTYYPFYWVKGSWNNAGKSIYDEEKLLDYQKGKFELGGMMVTDLAGHTGGGTGGLNANMPLSGVSGTSYSGLVGETGAMSSGEMFMNGGGVPQFSQQSYVIVDSFGSPAQHYGNGGDLTNERKHVNYKEDYEVRYAKANPNKKRHGYGGMKYADGGDFQTGVYAEGGSLENHGIKEGDTFIKTISGGIQKVKDKDGNIVFINLANGERDSQPPLPFKDGGELNYFVNKDGIKVSKMAEPKKKLTEKEWMAKYSDSKEARAYKNGGSLETNIKNRLSKNFSLPLEVAVYVPSTKDADEVISEKEFENRVESVQKYLSGLFGGFSANDVDGGYVSNEKGLIIEEVYKVISFAGKDDFSSKMEKLVGQIKRWANDWGQESIGLEFEGDLFYIDQEGNFADGGDIEAFSMRMVKGSGASPTEVMTEEKEVKFAKGGSLRDKRNKYLWKLGDKEANIWDKLGAESGAEIRQDKDMLRNYALKMESLFKSEEIGKGSFDEADYDIFEDANMHLLNEFLVWNNYYEPEMTVREQKWRTKNFSDPKYKNYISDPKVITVNETSSSENKSKNYIVNADIKSVTVNKKGTKYTFKGSDVLNGANILEKGNILETKAIYIPKRDVISVELKDGSEVKPANGYWIKKDASGELFKTETDKAENGTVVKKKSGNPKMKEAMVLAKKIRKDGEKWTDAVKRAYAQVK